MLQPLFLKSELKLLKTGNNSVLCAPSILHTFQEPYLVMSKMPLILTLPFTTFELKRQPTHHEP